MKTTLLLPRKNIILKEIIFLFLITVLPLILLCGISLYQSNYKLTKQALDTYRQKNQSFVSSVDSDFDRLKIAASQIITHSQYNQLSYTTDLMTSYEKVQAILQLREYVSSIKFGNSLIDNIKIYNLPLLKAYNAYNYKHGSYEEITVDDFNRILTIKNQTLSPFICLEDSLLLLLSSNMKAPSSIVEVELSSTNLRKLFQEANAIDCSFYIFNFNNTEYVMSNITDDELFSAALEMDSLTTEYIKMNGIRYEVFRSDFTSLNGYYLQLIPDTLLIKPLWQNSLYVILFTIFLFLWILVYFYGVIKIVHRPLVRLIHAFEKAETGDLSIRIVERDKSEFSYLYESFNKMADNLDTLINQVYNQRLLLQKAEFKQLQAQINPHFLYNSFFMLQRLIKCGIQEESVKMAGELGLYFKYITKNKSEFVSLAAEYNHARIYSNIQALRFEGRIAVEFDELPVAAALFQVPRLILQPLIENAYNYGLENKVEEGFLRIQFSHQKEGFYIHVEDNGDALSEEALVSMKSSLESSDAVFADSSESALHNICRRIHIFYKNNSNLTLSRSELGGLCVTVYLETEGETEHEEITYC